MMIDTDENRARYHAALHRLDESRTRVLKSDNDALHNIKKELSKLETVVALLLDIHLPRAMELLPFAKEAYDNEHACFEKARTQHNTTVEVLINKTETGYDAILPVKVEDVKNSKIAKDLISLCMQAEGDCQMKKIGDYVVCSYGTDMNPADIARSITRNAPREYQGAIICLRVSPYHSFNYPQALVESLDESTLLDMPVVTQELPVQHASRQIQERIVTTRPLTKQDVVPEGGISREDAYRFFEMGLCAKDLAKQYPGTPIMRLAGWMAHYTKLKNKERKV